MKQDNEMNADVDKADDQLAEAAGNNDATAGVLYTRRTVAAEQP